MTLLRTTTVAALAAAGTAFLLAVPAFGYETLLRCSVNDAVSLQDDGSLSRDDNAARTARGDDYIVDLTTGAVRLCLRAEDYCESLTAPWIVVNRGNSANDAVLVPPGPSGEEYELSWAATDFIRIRQWTGHGAILFLRYSLSTLASGTCGPLR